VITVKRARRTRRDGETNSFRIHAVSQLLNVFRRSQLRKIRDEMAEKDPMAITIALLPDQIVARTVHSRFLRR